MIETWTEVENGLEIPETHDVDNDLRNDWSSRILYLEAQQHAD
ncbi:MAG: hypothetical protein ACI4TU_02010 [Candidatus Cryptobacteroides sp.]